ncbi:MAG: cell wall metabolism sensor histidine kinase WalK [Phycisphaerales bacterium]|nr:cell wall metabolism sensor histidine kinase WalK [Phycisphaerales bacterium]
MLTQPLTAILLLTTMASAVVAVVFALKWKKYKLEAEEAIAQQQESTQHTMNELESAKIHGCIDRTRRRQVEAVFEVLKDAVIVIDAHGEVLHTNDIASALLTCSPKQAAGQPIDDVISDHQLLATIKDARTGLPREGRMYEQEITVGDSTTAFEVQLQSVGSIDDAHHAVVTVLRDLSQEREIARLKSDFVSKASHELRTPLSSIAAYVEMLIDGDANSEEERGEFYAVISTETERLRRMIDNLLNISRIEAGLMHIDRDTCDFKMLVDRAVTNMSPQASEKELDIHVQLSAVDLSVNADSDMLYQVIVNLLSNAIKYTPEGGRITLSADTDNLTRSLHFSITDTGLGIAPDQVGKVFDKFYRVENYKRVAQGTGLGLNLCQHIIETLHSGQIGLESDLGMGSKFWFSIPLGGRAAKAA